MLALLLQNYIVFSTQRNTVYHLSKLLACLKINFNMPCQLHTLSICILPANLTDLTWPVECILLGQMWELRSHIIKHYVQYTANLCSFLFILLFCIFYLHLLCPFSMCIRLSDLFLYIMEIWNSPGINYLIDHIWYLCLHNENEKF